MRTKLTIIVLVIVAILGSASGWTYHTVAGQNNEVTQGELMNLQVSFMQQYGTEATVTELINPKIYEVAWTGGDGTKNVSLNVGGIWVLIASVPATITPAP